MLHVDPIGIQLHERRTAISVGGLFRDDGCQVGRRNNQYLWGSRWSRGRVLCALLRSNRNSNKTYQSNSGNYFHVALLKWPTPHPPHPPARCGGALSVVRELLLLLFRIL